MQLFMDFFFTVRPLSVEILFNNQPLSSDRNYQIECEAVGSRPPAKITWWMGGIELTGHTQKVRAYIMFSFMIQIRLISYLLARCVAMYVFVLTS